LILKKRRLAFYKSSLMIRLPVDLYKQQYDNIKTQQSWIAAFPYHPVGLVLIITTHNTKQM